jgi:hypothetical protein
MAHNFRSKKSKKDDLDSNSRDEVHDEVSFLHHDNEELASFLDNRDDILK